MIDPASFEGAVIARLLEGNDPVLAELRAQAALASVRESERSEYGVLIDLWVEDAAVPLDATHRWAIDDLFGRVRAVTGEAGFQLHLVRGRIRTLEAWVSEPGWPDDPRLEESWYVGPDPDPEKAERVRLTARDLDFAVRGIEGDPED